MDIQASFASQLYETAARLGTQRTEGADAAEEGGESFAETLARAAQDITGTLQRGEAVAQQAVTGQGDAQAVVEALTATELALQTAVTLRDRVVEAYQEVLRMPV